VKAMKVISFALLSLLLAKSAVADDTEVAGVSDMVCDDANILSNVFDQVCWSCFIDGIDIGGLNPNRPDGSSSQMPCQCEDDLGIPQIGIKASYQSITRIAEVVTQPWCSPSLGGIQLQDSEYGQGYIDTDEANNATAFFQYHYFAYPLMEMLEILMMPECTGSDIIDFDLMYVSEIDPTWNDDLLALLMSPEAVLFGSPPALAWCGVDCVLTTADEQEQEFYGCAACDGLLYPFTGNINPVQDPVAASSLAAQRAIASLHRKGLATRTMGNEAMCGERILAPMIPSTQYRFSMMYPTPEAEGNAGNLISGASSNNAGQAGEELDRYGQCCHPMGMSTARWATAAGGRMPPGKDSAFIYMIWNYQDCCIR